jgi:hypothetical protein
MPLYSWDERHFVIPNNATAPYQIAGRQPCPSQTFQGGTLHSAIRANTVKKKTNADNETEEAVRNHRALPLHANAQCTTIMTGRTVTITAPTVNRRCRFNGVQSDTHHRTSRMVPHTAKVNISFRRERSPARRISLFHWLQPWGTPTKMANPIPPNMTNQKKSEGCLTLRSICQEFCPRCPPSCCVGSLRWRTLRFQRPLRKVILFSSNSKAKTKNLWLLSLRPRHPIRIFPRFKRFRHRQLRQIHHRHFVVATHRHVRPRPIRPHEDPLRARPHLQPLHYLPQ